MAESKATSPWVWVGCGCVGAIGLIVAGIVVAGLFLRGAARNLEEMMENPIARDEKAAAVLGADSLPEGYHSMVALEVPFIMKMALLSDQEPDEEGEVDSWDEWGFLYFDFLRLGNQQELLDFFEGREDSAKVLSDNGINFDLDERLARGELSREGDEILWVSHRGSVSVSQGSGSGITTVMLIECPNDKRRRLAAWFGPDPDPNAPPEELVLAGTPADEAALAALMAPMHPCGD